MFPDPHPPPIAGSLILPANNTYIEKLLQYGRVSFHWTTEATKYVPCSADCSFVDPFRRAPGVNYREGAPKTAL
jgi:hypothetical protein